MKVAVYTSIIGEYDKLKQPLVTDRDFDYICFVRKGMKTREKDGVWEIRELDFKAKNDRLLSRYPKMNPHKVLKNYNWSLWLDGNVQVASSEIYDIVREKVAAGTVYSGIRHPLRDCTYEEAKKCWRTGRISFFAYLRTFFFLRFNKYPRHTGLMENNVIFRAHHDRKIVEMDKLWWKRFRRGPHRDQLSFMWCLDKCRVMRDYLLPQGYSARNHPAFNYTEHETKA